MDDGLRLTDAISLGVLAEVVGRDVIEDVVDVTGRRQRRSRRLPAHVMVRFV
jgi:Insertion element 4 transposase N-terminal